MSLRMTAAGARAESLVGHGTPHGESGWCAEWTIRDVYRNLGPYRWGGNGRAWAINYWDAAKRWGKVVETSDPAQIPRGALTFSKGSSKYGHVFIAAGHGRCYTTDYPVARKIGHVRITDLLTGWNHRLLGYVLVTGEGVDLRDDVAPNRMDPAAYFTGAEGDHVLWLGQRLVAHGYRRTPVPYKPTTTFTKADLTATAWFQRQQKTNGHYWTGAAADGWPGAETLRRLAMPPN